MMNPTGPNTITISGLTKYYSRFTGISDLNLTIKQGEIFGFLGPNGAGKTTTIRLMLGLIKPSSGEIRIFDKNTEQYQKHLSNYIGYLPGDLGLYNDMSGYDYLRHFMRLRRGSSATDYSDRLKSLTNRFDISFNKKISTFSKGMKQVIGIIQAFMHDPKILILDEPTNGLDPLMQERFYELLMEEKYAGKTVFFSSHILSEVEKICDRAGFIKNGKLINVKEIGEYHASVVKKISFIPRGGAVQASRRLMELEGVKITEIKNEKVNLFYSGNMQMLIQCLTDIEIKDMICEPPSLEEVFHEYYEERNGDQ